MVSSIARSLSRFELKLSPRMAVIGAAILALGLFLTTLQLDVNGSSHPYATDVGEIQNALPRWGTIHFTGYPLYTAIGSAFVTALRVVGLPPAAGASLYSATWGAISIGLLTSLILAFGVQPVIAASSAVLFGLTTSMWTFASVAEVHTMTMALTFATVLVALRYGREGRTADLYLLAFLVSQGVAHQRAFVFMGLGLLVFVARQMPQWRIVVRKLPAITGLALLGPLTYLYLPMRAWQGADWVFSSPGTWNGFWALFLDTKADRIVEIPESLAELGSRIQGVFELLTADMPWLLLVLGLAGLLLPMRRVKWVERFGLMLLGATYIALSLIIWIGRVGEAVLATKLSVVAIAIIGLALLAQALWDRRPLFGQLAAAALIAAVAFLYLRNSPPVLAVTRDPSAQETIQLVASVPPAEDGRPSAIMALWGNDYWQLAYAQTFQNQFPEIRLLKHDRNFGNVLNQGTHLLTLSYTFYLRPPEWWEQLLGISVRLSSRAYGIVEISDRPSMSSADATSSEPFPLGNGIAIRHAELSWASKDTLRMTVEWQSQQDHLADYSVAVHLISQDPPTDPQHIIAQADQAHPVYGWYPTARWVNGEIVRDDYSLSVPPDSDPVAVRIGMYQVLADGSFQNSNWLSLPVPETP
ncbi:MAG TPA: DUF2723 domain-containing protein [Anaerolineae bacterium]|nr:DUF2723 domain-containing protein [Anaerolineae bacterium]